MSSDNRSRFRPRRSTLDKSKHRSVRRVWLDGSQLHDQNGRCDACRRDTPRNDVSLTVIYARTQLLLRETPVSLGIASKIPISDRRRDSWSLMLIGIINLLRNSINDFVDGDQFLLSQKCSRGQEGISIPNDRAGVRNTLDCSFDLFDGRRSRHPANGMEGGVKRWTVPMDFDWLRNQYGGDHQSGEKSILRELPRGSSGSTENCDRSFKGNAPATGFLVAFCKKTSYVSGSSPWEREGRDTSQARERDAAPTPSRPAGRRRRRRREEREKERRRLRAKTKRYFFRGRLESCDMFRSSLDEDNYCGIDELFILSSADEDSLSLKAMAMLREAIEDVGIKKKKMATLRRFGPTNKKMEKKFLACSSQLTEFVLDDLITYTLCELEIPFSIEQQSL
ncbi:hypothetical protein HZH68_011505 [Vespula germanica]|uniref:Uncharacterized protein n=2 Tax=Vespula TaxID=7451 RepID=A0A834JRC2_VESGE|nr:hypothetical protein HZH68_011505 [Vespula germanica]